VPSKLEDRFAAELKLFGLPEPKRQYRFCERLWRLDFYWEIQTRQRTEKIAVEIHGGIHSAHRFHHSNGAQLEKDFEKWSACADAKIRLYHFGPKAVYIPKNGSSVALAKMYPILKGES